MEITTSPYISLLCIVILTVIAVIGILTSRSKDSNSNMESSSSLRILCKAPNCPGHDSWGEECPIVLSPKDSNSNMESSSSLRILCKAPNCPGHDSWRDECPIVLPPLSSNSNASETQLSSLSASKSPNEAYNSTDQDFHALRIFLCHSSSDKPLVRGLYRRLKSSNFDPWLDEENLLPGQEWEQEIPRAVRESEIVLVCLSKASLSKAGYIQKEIRYALDVADEQPDGKIFIIPLKLEECEVPARLRKWQWVNLFAHNGYDRLLLSLKARADTKDKI
jgi:hypothetical protein